MNEAETVWPFLRKQSQNLCFTKISETKISETPLKTKYEECIETSFYKDSTKFTMAELGKRLLQLIEKKKLKKIRKDTKKVRKKRHITT